MVVGCRLGANLFPHCQMVKRVVGKRGAKKDLLSMMTMLMRHMAEENLVATRFGSPWPKGTKDEVLLQKLPVECFPLTLCQL